MEENWTKMSSGKNHRVPLNGTHFWGVCRFLRWTKWITKIKQPRAIQEDTIIFVVYYLGQVDMFLRQLASKIYIFPFEHLPENIRSEIHASLELVTFVSNSTVLTRINVWGWKKYEIWTIAAEELGILACKKWTSQHWTWL